MRAGRQPDLVRFTLERNGLAVYLRAGKHMTHSPRGIIEGIVINRVDRRVLADASVTIASGPSSAPDIAIVTDNSGTFEIVDLEVGIWELAALDLLGRSGHTTCEVLADQSASCIIEVG